MSRVFLLSSNFTTDPYPVYPLGMAVIAGALEADGHHVQQFDFLAAGCSLEKLRSEVKTFAPDVVGISLRNIDNVDSFSGEDAWYLSRAREQVRIIREVTAAPLVVGGPAFSIMPEEILSYLGADHGVVGEGEKLICRVVEEIAAGNSLPPLIRSEGKGLCGEEMGRPLYHPEWSDFYIQKSGMLNLQTKRGCPYGCIYCTYPALEGTCFRTREPEAVADDLERVHREKPNASIFFTDSVFNDPLGHYLQIAEEILRRGLEIRWCAFFRPEGIGRQELSLLKRSGLYALELGTDAASDATLEGLRKGFTFSDVLAVNQACLEEDLPCAHFIMFGGPDETPETIREGLENIEQLGSSIVFAFSGIRIFPGASLQDRAVAEGVITEEQSLLKPVYYFSPRIDPEAMNEALMKGFKGRRDRIFPPSEGQERLAVMQRFGFKGILWDQLVSMGRKREVV